MSDHSTIEWTDSTWSPITGCSVHSPGCTNCYAMKLAGTRLKHHPSRAGLTMETKSGPVWTGELRFNEQWLDQPIRWKKPRDIFVCAHADLFHRDIPEEWIARVFNTMVEAPQHRYQVLTKRSDHMRRLMDGPKHHEFWNTKLWHRSVLPNVLLGVSVEDQARADERRDDLKALAARGWRTFCSYEPALGPVDWRGWEFLSWMISGGENGPRPSHPGWHRAVRDFCAVNQIPYLFKQWGSWAPDSFDDRNVRAGWLSLDGTLIDDMLNIEKADCAKPCRLMFKVGKKAAGRFLDGREHNAFPQQTETAHVDPD